MALAIRSSISAPERTWVGHVAFIELDVSPGQVCSIENRFAFAQVQVQVELARRNCRAKILERGIGRLASLQTPKNAIAVGSAITNIDFLFDYRSGAVTNGIDDSAPIRVATMPACLHQRAVADCP